MISTKNVTTNSNSGVSQYIGPGNHELAIMDFNLRKSGSGRELLSLNVETRPVNEDNFTPSDDAKMGGKIGRVDLGIYSQPGDPAFDERLGNLVLIAEKIGIPREQLDAIEAPDMETYMRQYMNIVRGRFAKYLVGGREYLKENEDNSTSTGIALKFPRYGFVSSLNEEVTVYDPTNKYHLEKVEGAVAPSNDNFAASVGGSPSWDSSEDDSPF